MRSEPTVYIGSLSLHYDLLLLTVRRRLLWLSISVIIRLLSFYVLLTQLSGLSKGKAHRSAPVTKDTLSLHLNTNVKRRRGRVVRADR